MERRFDMSDFERSLKDHADQFKMIPSKRVWNGIYNNLHPGSKWPSITVAIIFLFTLITIGRFNTSTDRFTNPVKTDSNTGKDILKSQDQSQSGESVTEQKVREINSSKIDTKENNNVITKNKVDPQTRIISDKNSSVSLLSSSSYDKKNGTTNIKQQQRAKVISLNVSEFKKGSENNSEKNDISIDKLFSLSPGNTQPIPAFDLHENQNESFYTSIVRQGEMMKKDLSIPVSFQIFTLPPSESLYLNSIYSDQLMADAYKNLPNQENSLITHKKLRKNKNKIGWTFYINPIISTVSFNKKAIQPSANNSSLVVLSNQAPFKLKRNPRLGMETGVEMSFKIDKKFNFITGFNLSYSSYNNLSNLVHPTYATLTLTDGNGGTYTKNYITHYGNGQSPGHVSLVNYTIHASIPLGVQFNIWGNEKIKLDLASLIEPSVLLKNDAFLISSDGRYYVNDPMLVRRTNLDGHLGSYITIIGKKMKWHIGPDFRFQLFSTYKSIYPIKEHLIDYGIRIGISK